MRKVWHAVLIIVLSMSISGCSLFSSNAYIDEANKNMDINGLKLLIKENPKQDILDKGLSFTPGGFGCNVYRSQNGDLQIIFSGFPDVQDEYMLTNIETSNPAYHFYGIGVGDTFDKTEEILIKNGFTKPDKSSGFGPTRFSKSKLFVSFVLNDRSGITKMTIGLTQTNKENIVF